MFLFSCFQLILGAFQVLLIWEGKTTTKKPLKLDCHLLSPFFPPSPSFWHNLLHTWGNIFLQLLCTHTINHFPALGQHKFIHFLFQLLEDLTVYTKCSCLCVFVSPFQPVIEHNRREGQAILCKIERHRFGKKLGSQYQDNVSRKINSCILWKPKIYWLYMTLLAELIERQTWIVSMKFMFRWSRHNEHKPLSVGWYWGTSMSQYPVSLAQCNFLLSCFEADQHWKTYRIFKIFTMSGF